MCPGYAASSGDRAISIPLESDGPHLLEIRVRSDRNTSSTGNMVRFKQLVVDGEYDLRQIDYSYDKLSRLIAASHIDGTTHSYGYDPAGNMVNMDGVTRTYNAANQMTNDGTSALSYDNNGNLQTGGYVWDRANRLRSHGGIDYAYDGLNNRISQANGLDVTQYLLDLQPGLTKVLRESDGTNTNHFIHDPRGIHALDNGASWNYMLQDGLGSVRAESDSLGALQASQSYTSYGQPMNALGSFASPFGFTGEQTDDNDLLYLRARYYDPTLGVFPSLDPFEGIQNRPMSLNGYSWVEGNVPNMNDPSGRIGESPEQFVDCAESNVQEYARCDCPPGWVTIQRSQSYERSSQSCQGEYFECTPPAQPSMYFTPTGAWHLHNRGMFINGQFYGYEQIDQRIPHCPPSWVLETHDPMTLGMCTDGIGHISPENAWMLYEETQQLPHNCSLRGLTTFTQRSHLFSVNYSGYAGIGGGSSIVFGFEPNNSRFKWGVFLGAEFGGGLGGEGLSFSVGYGQTEASIEQFAGIGVGGSFGIIASGNVSMSLDGNCNVTRGASISVGGGFNVSITGLQATLFTNDLDNALQSVGLDNTVVEEVIRDIID